jgi:hypothetical protein
MPQHMPQHMPQPRATVQPMMTTRSSTKAAAAPTGVVHSPPPPGFALVGKYVLMKQGVDKDAKIYQKTVTLADGKSGTLLWWEYPLYQIDDFVYHGDRQTDINDCNRKCEKEGYTWHHTGWPIDEQHGTMQLVPTDEHSVLGHVGGIVISKGGHVE